MKHLLDVHLKLPPSSQTLCPLDQNGICLPVEQLHFDANVFNKMRTDMLGIFKADDARSYQSQNLETGRNIVISLHFSHGVASRHVLLDTVDEILHSLDQVVAEHVSRAFVIDEVMDGHQEVSIVDSVLDTQFDHGLAVIQVHHLFIKHVSLVELADDVACSLSRGSISAWDQLFVQWLVDDVSRQLILRSIHLSDVAVFEDLSIADGASIPDVVVAFLEEQRFQVVENSLHSLVERGRDVSDRILEPRSKFESHVPE